MTYEDQAAMVAAELKSGASLADALRMLDLRAGRRGPAKLSLTQRTEMRRRRAAGEKLATIADDFHVTEGTASAVGRGIPRPQVNAVTMAAIAFDLAAGRCAVARTDIEPGHGRGRPRPEIVRARRVAMLSMKQLGLSYLQVAAVMRQHVRTVVTSIAIATENRDLLAIAGEVVLQARQALAPSQEDHAA